MSNNYPIEQDDIDNLKFNGDGAGCNKAENEDNFVMTINSPFSDCGTRSTTNEDGDFVFNNAIRWVFAFEEVFWCCLCGNFFNRGF